MFVCSSYTSHQIQALNRCRILHRLLFLLDIALACGKSVDPLFLLPPSQDSVSQHELSYTFPTCKPSQADWKLWQEFWGATTGTAGLLHIPLGEWLHQSHRIWNWFYCEHSDIFRRQGETITMYIRAINGSRICSRQQYCQGEEIDAIPHHCIPANVIHTPGGMVVWRSIGPLLAIPTTMDRSFWDYL